MKEMKEQLILREKIIEEQRRYIEMLKKELNKKKWWKWQKR